MIDPHSKRIDLDVWCRALLRKLYKGSPASEYPMKEPLAPSFASDVKPVAAGIIIIY